MHYICIWCGSFLYSTIDDQLRLNEIISESFSLTVKTAISETVALFGLWKTFSQAPYEI